MHKSLVLLLASLLSAASVLGAEPLQPGGVVRNNLNPQPLPPVAPTPGENPRLQRSGLNPQPLPPLESGRLSNMGTGARAGAGVTRPPVPANPAGQVPHPEGTGPRQTPVGTPAGQIRERAVQAPAAADSHVPVRSSLSSVLETGSGAGK